MKIDKTRFRLITMFLISTIGRCVFLFKRKHQVDDDTSLGPAKDPLIPKLA